MQRLTTTLALLSFAAVSCGKSEATLRHEIKSCSAVTLDAPGISKCLVAQFKWDSSKAAAAGAVRQRELDSISAFQKDSIWKMDEKTHRKELADCAAGGGDLARCLENSHGWDEQRAVSVADSLWRREAPKHRSQIQNCQRQKKSSVGSCLMLYYKWDSKRALALDDSVMRAKARAWKSK
jgi:hypothetical protein